MQKKISLIKFIGRNEIKKEQTELDKLLERRKILIRKSRTIKRELIEINEQIQKEKRK